MSPGSSDEGGPPLGGGPPRKDPACPGRGRPRSQPLLAAAAPFAHIIKSSGLVGGHGVLDVRERVRAARALQRLQHLPDARGQVLPPPLAVVHRVAQVLPLGQEEVHHAEQLPVVGHQRLAHARVAAHELLDAAQRGQQHGRVARVQRAPKPGHHLGQA
eukprot:CAMPEP_0194579322 /NCGR_PEP_ID=MMETSP0292-20121207/13420_1 /TAXON_ID=39354 /ORGANISM="Heterosigma akashiwo, Strain CCMP2393" /LENGTH=158 /DNA_ID=CAMNT_0039432221 /DNA_START=101 /DNA_END=575 /DNA_ORIENTATION=-